MNRQLKFNIGDIVSFREDVYGADRLWWHGERNITAELVTASIDRTGRIWVRLRVMSATGHRARELAPEIRRSLKTVKQGIPRFHQWNAKRARSKRSRGKRADRPPVMP